MLLATVTVCAAVVTGVAVTRVAGAGLVTVARVLGRGAEALSFDDPYEVTAWADANPARATRDAPPPLLEHHACPFAGEWRSEGVRCATLVVPADRSDATSTAVVEVAVAVLPATGPDPADDPLVFLTGGPGGASVAWFDDWGDVPLSRLRRDRDVVLLDQRGTGYSTPTFGCDGTWNLAGPAVADALARCRDRALADGIVLDGFSTREHAADVADLRRAMGVERWNLLGVSYGTRVALAVLRDDAEGVRSVVLDSAYPQDVDGLAEQAPNAAAAFDEVATACREDLACHDEHGDLHANLLATTAMLDERPIRVAGVDYDGTQFTYAVVGALYDETQIVELPGILAAATDDPRAAVRQLAGWGPGGPPFGAARRTPVPAYQDSDGTLFAVQCREEYLTGDLDAARSALDALSAPFAASGRRQLEEYEAVCSMLSIGPATPAERAPATSDVPTLILAGRFDPVTPPAWGHRAARTLTASTVVDVPIAAHGVLYSGLCPSTIARDFLRDPTASVDARCVEQRQRLSFR